MNCLHSPILSQMYENGLPSTRNPLLFFIYVNNILDGLTTNARLLTDDFFVVVVAHNIRLSATNLNSDSSKINAWKNQWKWLSTLALTKEITIKRMTIKKSCFNKSNDYHLFHQKRKPVNFFKKYLCIIYVTNCFECKFQKFTFK